VVLYVREICAPPPVHFALLNVCICCAQAIEEAMPSARDVEAGSGGGDGGVVLPSASPVDRSDEYCGGGSSAGSAAAVAVLPPSLMPSSDPDVSAADELQVTGEVDASRIADGASGPGSISGDGVGGGEYYYREGGGGDASQFVDGEKFASGENTIGQMVRAVPR
jgi:hypothetical protein